MHHTFHFQIKFQCLIYVKGERYNHTLHVLNSFIRQPLSFFLTLKDCIHTATKLHKRIQQSRRVILTLGVQSVRIKNNTWRQNNLEA